jgi:hypothetical protein
MTCTTADLPLGDLWLFVATSAWDLTTMPCPGRYVMTLDGYFCIVDGVQPTSWSKIKADYR